MASTALLAILCGCQMKRPNTPEFKSYDPEFNFVHASSMVGDFNFARLMQTTVHDDCH